MTAAPGATVRVAAAGLCCVVAALAYAGAVSLVALLAFVLPIVVVVTVVTAVVARLSLRLAVGSGLLAALAAAEVVNIVSGTSNGPAARSSFVAAACTVLAVAAVLGPAPGLFAAAVVGVAVGALGLGAGAEVAPVAVATAVVTVVALAVVEAQGRHWTRRTPQLASVVVLALLVGGLVATVALQAERRLEGEPAVLAPGAVDRTIQPPSALGDPDPEPPPDQNAGSDAPPSSEPVLPVRTIWLVILVVVLALLMSVMLRVLWIALAWRRLRRRLQRGSGPEQVAGAWVWSTRRLRVAGWPMPPSLSADAVSADEGTAGLPRVIRSALRQVAGFTVGAVYAPPVEEHDPQLAWAAADQVGRSAVSLLSPAQRLGFAVRPISSVPTRSTATAPARSEEDRS